MHRGSILSFHENGHRYKTFLHLLGDGVSGTEHFGRLVSALPIRTVSVKHEPFAQIAIIASTSEADNYLYFGRSNMLGNENKNRSHPEALL